MGNMFAQQPVGAHMAAHPVVTSAARQNQSASRQNQPGPAVQGGGFDRLFGQFANQAPGGTIWGNAAPPLYGHHAMFNQAPGKK